MVVKPYFNRKIIIILITRSSFQIDETILK